MLKDIPQTEVTDIAIAICPTSPVNALTDEEELWNVYIINLKTVPIDNVIVSSQGYGSYKGESVKTSTLRQFFGTLKSNSYTLIEPIQKKVFGLNNEYWVSFYIGKEIFDKKFIFLPESITEEYFTTIPFINVKGVMIR
jgi:hypothetical protein